VGELYFISKNSGLQNQFVINVRKGLDGEDQVFIDPNAIDPAGTTTFSLMGGTSKDRYMAVGVQKAGSDWQDITVYDLTTMKQLPDVLKWAKFSGVAWYKDGFFYSRYPEPAKGTELSAASKFQKVYYHKLGDAQEKDVLVWENKVNGDLYVGAGVTEGEEFATLYVSTGTDGYEMYFHDLRKGGIPNPSTAWTPLQQGFDHKTSIVEFVPATGKFLVMTEVDAPNYRLVEVDPAKPAKENWKDIIPQREELLQGVSTGGPYAVREYLKDATTRILPLQARWHGRTGDPTARSRQRGRLRRKAGRHLRLLQLHQLHRPRHHLQIRLRHGKERGVQPPRAEVRSFTVRH
jgi:prolyl oligopeptidase